ncbi:MAG TPA: hypothetical protein DCQ31_16395, partial [Bacteroidales bacterium]|nr:hypothetical protein [Bacteroidales bacterium]
LSKISTGLSVSWSNSYPLIEDGEEMLIKHITKRGTTFPFFVDYALAGNTVSYYYLNGFYRYSFSTVFASATDGSLLGVNNGFRYEGAISSAIQLSGNSFALTYFFRGKNFYLHNHSFNTSATTSIENLGGIQLTDLVTDAAVKATRMKINGSDVLIFASNSNLNRIVLNVFDAATGSLLNKYEINQAAQTELGAIAPTADNGLVITGKTMVFGKFPRIFVLKIPSSKIVGEQE